MIQVVVGAAAASERRIGYAPQVMCPMMTETLSRVSPIRVIVEWAVAVCAGWCTGMFAAYGVILANAKIGSGPTAHPEGTWFVGLRSAVLAIVLAIALRLLLGFIKKHLLMGAAVGMAMPLVTLYWLYS